MEVMRNEEISEIGVADRAQVVKSVIKTNWILLHGSIILSTFPTVALPL